MESESDTQQKGPVSSRLAQFRAAKQELEKIRYQLGEENVSDEHSLIIRESAAIAKEAEAYCLLTKEEAVIAEQEANSIEGLSTVNNIRRLAKAHIKRYRHRIKSGLAGNTSVNISECSKYLQLWMEILRALDYAWDKLSPTMKEEITDAIEAGE